MKMSEMQKALRESRLRWLEHQIEERKKRGKATEELEVKLFGAHIWED